jgi:hypothetical protein
MGGSNGQVETGDAPVQQRAADAPLRRIAFVVFVTQSAAKGTVGPPQAGDFPRLAG